MVGCYNGDRDAKEGDRHGVDFTLHGPAFVIGETGYRWNYSDKTSLPGNAKLGAFLDGGSAAVFDSRRALISYSQSLAMLCRTAACTF
jgi:hypothetical protein